MRSAVLAARRDHSGLEPSHALAFVGTIIGKMDKDQIMILNMCGRGDKDLGAVLPMLEERGKL